MPGDPHAAQKLVFLGLYFVVFTAPLVAAMVLAADRVVAALRGHPRGRCGASTITFAGLFSAFALRILATAR